MVVSPSAKREGGKNYNPFTTPMLGKGGERENGPLSSLSGRKRKKKKKKREKGWKEFNCRIKQRVLKRRKKRKKGDLPNPSKLRPEEEKGGGETCRKNLPSISMVLLKVWGKKKGGRAFRKIATTNRRRKKRGEELGNAPRFVPVANAKRGEGR